MRYLGRAAVAVLVLGSVSTSASEWESRGTQPPRKVVVATTMYGIYGEHPGLTRRLQDAAELIDRAAEAAVRQYPGEGLDLVVLTEGIISASGDVEAAKRTVELEGPVLEQMGGKAREHHTYVVLPVLLAEPDGRSSNAAVLLDRQGQVAGVYRKVHPVTDYPSDALEGGMAPGSDFPVFDTDFGRLGIQICWDMVFEDGWEALARQGAQIVALPTAAPQVARPSAHALLGDYYVVSSTPANNASIFNPLGMVDAQITEAGVLVHRLDLSYAVVHWIPGLEDGRSLSRRYGDRAGYTYYESEATGLFWSNDPTTPISSMLQELGLMEMRPYIERNRRAQDAARGAALD